MRVHLGHFEIPARDPERAAEFFRRAFGWSAQAVPWDGPVYLALRAPEALNGEDPPRGPIQGGLLAAEGAGFDHPLPVLHLTDGTLEDCLARVESAGGKTTEPPRAVGPFGRFARFCDPEGHEWGVWSADARE